MLWLLPGGVRRSKLSVRRMANAREDGQQEGLATDRRPRTVIHDLCTRVRRRLVGPRRTSQRAWTERRSTWTDPPVAYKVLRYSRQKRKRKCKTNEPKLADHQFADCSLRPPIGLSVTWKS
jgi:hypothetical protein